MENPARRNLILYIVDLLIFAVVIGLLYLETSGLFKFSVELSVIIIGVGIITILLVNIIVRSRNTK